MAEYTCKVCGGAFRANPSRRQIYCSKACESIGKRGPRIARVERACKICGKPFETLPKSKRSYCSWECRNVALGRQFREGGIIYEPHPHKQCSRCLAFLPPDREHFGSRKNTPDGLDWYCRPCKAAIKRQRRVNNLEEERRKGRQYAARYSATNRDKVNETARKWRNANKDRLNAKRRTPEERAKSSASSRAWRHRHPDRVRAGKAKNYARRRDHIIQYQKRYRANNRDKIAARNRKYQAEHKDELREYYRKYNQRHRDKVNERSRRNYHRNIFYNRAYKRQQAKKHREQYRVHKLWRRARQHALPVAFTNADWEHCLKHFNGCCAYCGSQAGLWNPITADHFIPLTDPSCPGTVPNNMIPACKSCNSGKCDRDPAEWLTWKFDKTRARAILARIEAYFASLKDPEE